MENLTIYMSQLTLTTNRIRVFDNDKQQLLVLHNPFSTRKYGYEHVVINWRAHLYSSFAPLIYGTGEPRGIGHA